MPRGVNAWGRACLGVCAWLGGVHGQGDACGGVCGRGGMRATHAPPARYHEIRSVNERAVRILLDAFLLIIIAGGVNYPLIVYVFIAGGGARPLDPTPHQQTSVPTVHTSEGTRRQRVRIFKLS